MKSPIHVQDFNTIHYTIHNANESNLMEIYIEIDVEGETADTDNIVCLLLIHKFKKDHISWRLF